MDGDHIKWTWSDQFRELKLKKMNLIIFYCLAVSALSTTTSTNSKEDKVAMELLAQLLNGKYCLIKYF